MTLVRKTLPGVFSFEYELPTPFNATETPKTLDLENELPSVLQFEVGPNDIGGTLSVDLFLDHNRVRPTICTLLIILLERKHSVQSLLTDEIMHGNQQARR